MKLIIAGGRHFDDYQLLLESFDFGVCWEFGEVDCIFSGCAKGADSLGERLAKERGIRVSRFPANWDYHGKKAGILRNEEMAEWADGLLAFWDGESTGTKHMIDYAKSMGLIVHVVMYDKEKKVDVPLNVIIDFETVDKIPTAAVASMAVIVFDPSVVQDFDNLVKNSFRIKFNLAEQYSMGRTWEQSTVDWWMAPEQADAFQRVIVPSTDDVSINELPIKLKQYLDRMGYKPNVGEKIYARGNAFDMPLMENIFTSLGAEAVLPWWGYRDVRTEIDAIAPYWNPEHKAWGNMNCFVPPASFVKHIDTHDCAIDVIKMQYAHLKLMKHFGMI